MHLSDVTKTAKSFYSKAQKTVESVCSNIESTTSTAGNTAALIYSDLRSTAAVATNMTTSTLTKCDNLDRLKAHQNIQDILSAYTHAKKWRRNRHSISSQVSGVLKAMHEGEKAVVFIDIDNTMVHRNNKKGKKEKKENRTLKRGVIYTLKSWERNNKIAHIQILTARSKESLERTHKGLLKQGVTFSSKHLAGKKFDSDEHKYGFRYRGITSSAGRKNKGPIVLNLLKLIHKSNPKVTTAILIDDIPSQIHSLAANKLGMAHNTPLRLRGIKVD